MVKINIEELLKKKGKTKYWLCKQMNLTSRNLNRIIRGETTAISFRYIEEFCDNLNCTPNELITIDTNIQKEYLNI
ncbi:MAG: helix-turn-helix transcriptional regulator [Bacilli bacterium]|nr:helix-turn-helix transcriptional regulator [Bacilli bacterium]